MNPPHHQRHMTSTNDNASNVLPNNKFSFTSTQHSKFSLSNYATNTNNSISTSSTNNPYRTPFTTTNNNYAKSSSSSTSQLPASSSSTTTTNIQNDTQFMSPMNNSDGIENTSNFNQGSLENITKTPSNNNNNHHQSQDLESKLHETAASFRKSRDEAHRNHTIAQERLRIVQEEYKNVQTSIQSMQQHLQSIQQTYTNDQSKYTALKTEVQQLSHEVHFQHAELVSKRNQLHEQRTTGPLGEQACAERQAILDHLHHTIQTQQDKLRSKNRTTSAPKLLHPTILTEYFKENIPQGQTEVPSPVLRRWIRVFEKSASNLKEEINQCSFLTNDEIKKLKFLEGRYEEFIQTNVTNHQSHPTELGNNAHHHDIVMPDVEENDDGDSHSMMNTDESDVMATTTPTTNETMETTTDHNYMETNAMDDDENKTSPPTNEDGMEGEVYVSTTTK